MSQNSNQPKDPEEDKKPKVLTYHQQLKEIFKQLSDASKEKDFKTVQQETKKLIRFRKNLTPAQVSTLLSHFHLQGADNLDGFPIELGEVKDLQEKIGLTPEIMEEYQKVLEIQTFVMLLALIKKIDAKDFAGALNLAQFTYSRLEDSSLRTLDFQKSRIVYYMALAAERMGKLKEMRKQGWIVTNSFFYKAHRSSTLRMETATQATLICATVRQLLQEKQYAAAAQVVAKTTFPEKAPNNQLARIQFYQGRIKAVQLEYGEAQAHLQQAIRKAPEGKAQGFKLTAQKFLVVVELLMGEIPNRSIFNQFGDKLKAYYEVVKAVRKGDLEKFKEVLEEWGPVFESDDTLSLILRLRHNVIKFGLRNINLSYSRIALQDVMAKLGLDSIDETEAICAKAIRDGVIDAQINHEENYVKTKELLDLFETNEPQVQLNKRIRFCLNLYQEASRALEYPHEDELAKKKKLKPQDEEDEKKEKKQKDDKDSPEDDDDDSSLDEEDDLDYDDFDF